jgi:chromosome segregation protein
MYLKSIEIQGFKSFANKILFEFHQGITGIVGPNGSGKSNVADAVRWVLGEQRIKQLRGESMQDVIFSGTELRKPLGYAYVAITFDNLDHTLAIDYQEVTVARRLYRSGESEYSINGTPCRLKDVNELFYDTGIGKEGYSIIGQGQIEKILSGKPEEKRELFDEAAGIVKFKKRKATAQKKLEDEKNNLVRVTDILSELEKQVEPLERQSKKAREFLKKREELKELDINVFLLENKKLSAQLEETQEKNSIAKADYDNTVDQYEKIRIEYDNIQTRLDELDKEIEDARNNLADSGIIREKLEGEIKVLKEQINGAKSNETHFRERIESIDSQISERHEEKKVIFNSKLELDKDVLELENERNAAKEELERVQSQIEELNASIDHDNNYILKMINDRGNIKSKMSSFDATLEQLRIRQAELNSKLLLAKSDEVERDVQIEKLQNEFDSIKDEITDANEKLALMENETGKFKERLTNKDAEIRENQAKYQSYKSRYDTISNMAERYEGFGNSIKSVMEQKQYNKGLIGVVADIITTDKQYETAIETALGASINNIVTEDEKTAKEMIAFLKKTKGGRATFLPLTSITRPQEFKMTEVLGEKGVLGLADSLVHTDTKFANLAKSLLGRNVVVDNVDNALNLAKKYKHTLRIVTLEGELLVPGGAISGGAYKNNSNLLGRRRELEELKEKLKAAKEGVDLANRDIETIKSERNVLRKSIEEAKAALQELYIRQNTARMNLMAIQEKKSEAEHDYGSLKDEQKEIELKFAQINIDKEQTTKDLAASEEEEKDVNKRIADRQGELETLRTDEAVKSTKVNEWELKYEKMLQKQEFEQTNINRIDGEIERLNAELGEIRVNLEKCLIDIEDKEKNIETIEITISESANVQTKEQKALKEKQEIKEELSARQKNFFTRREEISERKNNLDREVYRLNSQIEKLEENIENQINYMWNEYEITLNNASSMQNEEFNDIGEMKKQILAIKDDIKKLGDVNVNAIEDYRVLMERYTFMKTQHDDLIEAEKTLEDIIEELDTAMRMQFSQKFEEIKKEFDKVFKELFGGGKGTLELTEGEDILEAGIRIIAQPPGKKLQNMMQLSGGEKSFTAIALLFAIQNLKPSPFCLLDEIEAALDEGNVTRFAKYLNKLTKSTQFIVITHRLGTMEQADRLYGITMQEKGVSTLVSVNLVDSEVDKWSNEESKEK